MSRGVASNGDNLESRTQEGVDSESQSRVRLPKLDSLSWQILRLAEADIPRAEFLARVAGAVGAYSEIESIDLCLRDRGRCSLACSGAEQARPGTSPLCRSVAIDSRGMRRHVARPLCTLLLGGEVALDELSRAGSLTLSGAAPLVPLRANGHGPVTLELDVGTDTRTSLLVPFAPQAGMTGLLALRSHRHEKRLPLEVELYESVAHLIGMTLAQRGSQRALRERVTQLIYLYRISELFARPDVTIEEMAQHAPQLIAQGCPAPGPVVARVRIDEVEAWWPERRTCRHCLKRDIVIQGRVRGHVEVRCQNWRGSSEECQCAEVQSFVAAVAGALASALHRSELRSEKEALKAQVQHAERLATIGTLMAMLAHEVKQPLATIHGFTELVQKDASLSPSARADLERVAAASRHVKGVVKKLLSFARASQPHRAPTSLNQAVEDALCFIEPTCVRAGVRVVQKLGFDLGELIADHEQLCQIVVNLSMNSVHAMPNGGVLTLETRHTPDACVLVVEDTGVGISDELKEKIFQPFFTTSERGRGLGLGLAVVCDIVSSHGGRLDLESEVGRGTRMTVTLPAKAQPSGDEPPPDSRDGE